MTPFLLAIAAILVAAKLGGELMERLNQPAVLGELLFGIVLGNIGLTGIELFDALKTAPFLAIAAEIGVILLLFQVGLESNLDELLAVGASAVGVAVLGVVAPIALGYAVSAVFMPGDTAWYVHLFLGATLAATSVGITARVLKDLGGHGCPRVEGHSRGCRRGRRAGPDRARDRPRAGARGRCGRDAGRLRSRRSC